MQCWMAWLEYEELGRQEQMMNKGVMNALDINYVMLWNKVLWGGEEKYGTSSEKQKAYPYSIMWTVWGRKRHYPVSICCCNSCKDDWACCSQFRDLYVVIGAVKAWCIQVTQHRNDNSAGVFAVRISRIIHSQVQLQIHQQSSWCRAALAGEVKTDWECIEVISDLWTLKSSLSINLILTLCL